MAVADFLAMLRQTAAWCVPVGADYESVALPLSYPGVPSGVYHSRSTPIIR